MVGVRGVVIDFRIALTQVQLCMTEREKVGVGNRQQQVTLRESV